MNTKEMLDLRHKIVIGTVDENELRDMRETLYSCIEQSKNVILGGVSEENFVGLSRIVKSAVLSHLLTDGKGKSILLADMAGELDGMLDTYFLAVLGLLMQEEIV